MRVTMARPGSISGTVLDERGEPIVGAHVRVLPQVPVAGRTQWLAGPVARTDDRGFYRIAGLGPGQYVVSVPYVQATLPAGAKPQRPGASAGTSMADLLAAREALDAGLLLLDAGSGQQLVVGRYATPPPAPDGGRMVYPTTFHPNVPVPADARAIDLGLSEDRTAIDFQLQPVRAVNVTGIVQGPPEAIANQHLRLLRAGLEELGQGSETATTLTDAEGRFTFVAVPAGSYVIDARHTMLDLSYTSMESMATALPAPVPFAARSAASLGVAAAPPGVSIVSLDDRSAVPYWAHAAIEVGDRDLDGIVVLLQRPVTLSGRIVLPSGSPAPRGGVGLTLEPADGRRTLGMLSSRPIDAQRFAFDNLMAGEYVLRSSFSTYSIDSVTWNGADYTDRPFDAAAGKDITEVTVRLAAVTSSVSGQVRDGTSDLTSGAAVIAFPIERERWSRYGFNPPRIKSALTTADGRFRIDRLPVGDYYVVAVPAARERAWLDPEFLALHAARASRIRIDRHDAALAGVALTLVR